jgi:hypothetical protein
LRIRAASYELFGGDALMFRTADREPRRRDRILPVTRGPRAEELKGVGTAAARSDKGVYLSENQLQEFAGFSAHRRVTHKKRCSIRMADFRITQGN